MSIHVVKISSNRFLGIDKNVCYSPITAADDVILHSMEQAVSCVMTEYSRILYCRMCVGTVFMVVDFCEDIDCYMEKVLMSFSYNFRRIFEKRMKFIISRYPFKVEEYEDRIMTSIGNYPSDIAVYLNMWDSVSMDLDLHSTEEFYKLVLDMCYTIRNIYCSYAFDTTYDCLSEEQLDLFYRIPGYVQIGSEICWSGKTPIVDRSTCCDDIWSNNYQDIYLNKLRGK